MLQLTTKFRNFQAISAKFQVNQILITAVIKTKKFEILFEMTNAKIRRAMFHLHAIRTRADSERTTCTSESLDA